MKRKLLIGIFIALLLFVGCSAWENAYEQAGAVSLKVVSIDGPSALSLIKAMAPEIKPSPKLGDTVRYTFMRDEEALYSELLKDDVDIAIVPTDLAMKLFEAGESYKLAAIITEGYLYVLGNEDSAITLADLEGKKVRVLNEFSAADIIFKALLNHQRLEPGKDLKLSYISGGEALIEDATGEKADYIILPEPWVTAFLHENSNFSIVMDLQSEWSKVYGERLPIPQTCLIVREETITSKNEAWTFFLEDYETSIEWVNAHPDKTAELVERFEIGISEASTEDIISRSHLIFMDTAEIKPAIQRYLNAFTQGSPEGSEGKLPDETFYYLKEQ